MADYWVDVALIRTRPDGLKEYFQNIIVVKASNATTAGRCVLQLIPRGYQFYFIEGGMGGGPAAIAARKRRLGRSGPQRNDEP